MRIIALEEHCLTPELSAAFDTHSHQDFTPPSYPPVIETKLLDLGAGRIADMDAAGIDVQVLSVAQPGIEQLPADVAVRAVREFNDQLADAVSTNPERFSAFAALATPAPEEAAAELERAVNELGFKGATIAGRTVDRSIDDQFFWPMWESAEALGVPIYLHPMLPPKTVYDHYYSGFGDGVGFAFSTAGWGWHVDTGLQCLRLILAGVLDRFPKLQIIIGHMGEAIPFMLDRTDQILNGRMALDAMNGNKATKQIELPVKDYLLRNFHLTTSALFTDAPLRCALDTFGVERIMFSVDYPFSNNLDGTTFLAQAPITDDERGQIAHGNAERLLAL